MTFLINLFFRNLIACLIYLLLAGSITQGKRTWRQDTEGEICDDSTTIKIDLNIKQEQEHKESAEIASLIAQKAAQEAKEASEAQNQAGAEAALEVKQELAQRAEDAARAGQAALAGKQAMVDELEDQIKEDEDVVKEQIAAEQRISEAGKVIIDNANEMETLAKVLQQAIQLAQQASSKAKTAVQIIERESDAKCKLITMTRTRISKLAEELKAAREDLEKTMEAAKKAVTSAKMAENNARRQRRVSRQQFRRRKKIR